MLRNLFTNKTLTKIDFSVIEKTLYFLQWFPKESGSSLESKWLNFMSFVFINLYQAKTRTFLLFLQSSNRTQVPIKRQKIDKLKFHLSWVNGFHGRLVKYLLVYLTSRLCMYRMVRWLKQSSNKICITWSRMHKKLRWLNFKMAQNPDEIWINLDHTWIVFGSIWIVGTFY